MTFATLLLRNSIQKLDTDSLQLDTDAGVSMCVTRVIRKLWKSAGDTFHIKILASPADSTPRIRAVRENRLPDGETPTLIRRHCALFLHRHCYISNPMCPWVESQNNKTCLTDQLFTDYMAYGILKWIGKWLDIWGNFLKGFLKEFLRFLSVLSAS